MSMLCSVYRIGPEHVTQLKDSPDAVGELLGFTTPPPQAGFLSRLFGKSARRPRVPAHRFSPVGKSDIFELDQAWHILHFLFSGCNDEGAWPAAFLMSGGEAIGADQGYGPARLLLPELLQDVDRFLDTQSFQTLDAAYVASKIEAAEIYWRPSSKGAERQRQLDELWGTVQALRVFFAETAQTRSSALISIY